MASQAELVEKVLEAIDEQKLSKKDQRIFQKMDVGVVHQGTKIVLPVDPTKMTKRTAVSCLERQIKEEEEAIAIHEEVDTYPLDGAFAFMKVLQARYGWATAIPKKTFFGKQPPTMVTLEIGFGKTTQIIWGYFKIPGIDGELCTSATQKDGRHIFVIKGEVLKKHQPEVKEIADQIREYIKHGSVYKGKAIQLKTTSSGAFDASTPPTFLDTDRIKVDELIFSKEVMEQVETNLFTPIEKTEACRELGIPLKRSILFEGPFGTGKTLTAAVTSKLCEENGWTYIYLDRVNAISQAMIFAKQYAPAVVFAEDIDRIVSGGRSIKVDDILNNIDGVNSKNQEIINIFTTNEVEKIEKAMLRPGRLDAIISIQPPDEEAAIRLMHLYSRGLLKKNESLDEAAKELAGQIPATIREAVERAKLYALSRLNKGEKLTKLISSDIAAAARGMKRHLELLHGQQIEELSDNEKLGAALAKCVSDQTNKSIKTADTYDWMSETHDYTSETNSTVSSSAELIEQIHKKVHG